MIILLGKYDVCLKEHLSKPQDCLYIDVVSTLGAIQEQKSVEANVHTQMCKNVGEVVA